uniref:Pyruvate kinase n=1 Tax=Solibacter usitatus (strain Ellin6076) TaxID=234267 RepID=Q01WK7_SOLUE
MPNTKIVATLGPATDAPGVLRQLLAAGVDVFRLNASHGAQDAHAARIDAVRAAAREAHVHAGILLDLQGPKIRLGRFENGGVTLVTDAIFTITTEQVMGTSERASTGYSRFAKDVKAGDRILLADGIIELIALESDGVSVQTRIVNGGPIGDHKGINLPGVQVSIPSLTEKDLADLHFGLNAGVDIVALSFVRTADDVRQLRDRLGGRPVSIVAKIEKPEGYENIEPILDVTDGVMVARGDLGVEISLERVPRIQKSIIRRARRKGRFVITATQMLESMIENPRPTRAEVSDVANAIYDGTDAVMLSAETSVGKYPVEAVRYMAKIAAESEDSIRKKGYIDPPHQPQPSNAEILADAAHHAARDSGAAAIVVFSSRGSSARLVSRYRPPVGVFAITPHDTTARQLSVSYGVTPLLAPDVSSTDEMLSQMDRVLIEGGYLQKGQLVVFVAGQPVGRPGTTNLMKLHRVGLG